MHHNPPAPQAMVAPEHEPEPAGEDLSEATLPPTSPATCPPTTPATCPPTTSRKRANELTLAYLQAESAKEQKRHEETKAKTERFLVLFERLVNNMPEQ